MRTTNEMSSRRRWSWLKQSVDLRLKSTVSCARDLANSKHKLWWMSCNQSIIRELLEWPMYLKHC